MSLSLEAAPGVDQPFERGEGDARPQANLSGFAKSYALVIGISNFTGGYDDLPTSNDAKRMADYLFEEAGFDYVHLLTEDQVTRDRVAELMSETFPAVLGSNDRFLFYWSGHGDTRDVAYGDGKAGYLALRDTAPAQWSRMIAMRDVREWNRFLKAKQSLFLLDSCFGGIAGTVTKNRPPQQAKIGQLAQPGHHVMSAGTEMETTIAGDRWGGSLFTAAILDGLRGDADAARDGFPRDNIISLTELKAYVQDRVLLELRETDWLEPITPQVRDLRKNAGEFFFLADPSNAVASLESRGSGAAAIQEKSSGTAILTPGQIESSLSIDGRAVQQSLSALGYSPGVADGILGPRSRNTLLEWQSASGYEPTGYLTAEQYERLLSDVETELARTPPTAPEQSVAEPLEPPKPSISNLNDTADGYRLGPGDQIKVTVFRHADLSGEFELDGEGFSAFPLIGEVQAGGRTARQLENDIETAFEEGGYLVDPRISVEVLNYRPFYILGEVNQPGGILMLRV